MEYSWKPKTWLAVILGLLLQNYAFLYVNRLKLFWLYFIPIIIVSLIDWKYETIFYGLFYLICPIHAYLIATDFAPIDNRAWYSTWWGLPIMSISTVLFILIFVVMFRTFLFEPFRLVASSMEPTIKDGAHMIVDKYGYNTYGTLGFTLSSDEVIPIFNISSGEISSPDLMQRGKIYAFYPPNKDVPYVKRLIAVPGDSVSIVDDNLIVNGIALATAEVSETEQFTIYEEKLGNEKYLTQYNHWTSPSGMNEILVPDGKYFFMGDNRDNSNDSRYLGFISNDQIVGKVIYISD